MIPTTAIPTTTTTTTIPTTAIPTNTITTTTDAVEHLINDWVDWAVGNSWDVDKMMQESQLFVEPIMIRFKEVVQLAKSDDGQLSIPATCDSRFAFQALEWIVTACALAGDLEVADEFFDSNCSMKIIQVFNCSVGELIVAKLKSARKNKDASTSTKTKVHGWNSALESFKARAESDAAQSLTILEQQAAQILEVASGLSGGVQVLGPAIKESLERCATLFVQVMSFLILVIPSDS